MIGYASDVISESMGYMHPKMQTNSFNFWRFQSKTGEDTTSISRNTFARLKNLEQVIESTASILQNWASYGWLLDSLTQKIHFRVTMFSFGITSKSAKISAQTI